MSKTFNNVDRAFNTVTKHLGELSKTNTKESKQKLIEKFSELIKVLSIDSKADLVNCVNTDTEIVVKVDCVNKCNCHSSFPIRMITNDDKKEGNSNRIVLYLNTYESPPEDSVLFKHLSKDEILTEVADGYGTSSNDHSNSEDEDDD